MRPYVSLLQLGNSTLGRVPLPGLRFLAGVSVKSTDPLSIQMDKFQMSENRFETDLSSCHRSLQDFCRRSKQGIMLVPGSKQNSSR